MVSFYSNQSVRIARVSSWVMENKSQSGHSGFGEEKVFCERICKSAREMVVVGCEEYDSVYCENKKCGYARRREKGENPEWGNV